MQTLGIVLVVMFGLVALCLFFHFIAYTIPGWVPHEIPTRNRRRRAANRANVRNATGRVTTRNATTTTADDGIIAPGPARARAGIVVDGGPLPRLPAAAATLLPRSASGTTVSNGVNGAAATSRPIATANVDGSVGIQLAIVPQFVRINGGRGGGSSSNSGNTGNARPAAAVPRVAGRAPPTRRAPPEYDVEAGLADPPPRYSERLGEHDSQTVIARAA